MIRHAAAAFPVVPLPVAVIEPPSPGFAGAAGWRPALVAAVFFAGIARRSNGGPGHNDNRSRTPRHSRTHGKSVGAGAPRGSPSPPLRRDGTTAARQGNLDPIYR